jgi:hypothetical protein
MPEQNFANHTRFDPKFHFFAAPILAINLVWALWRLVENPHIYNAWSVVIGAAFIVMLLTTRLYALKVQDRVIRLEERLRIVPLLPAAVKARWHELTEGQLVALRFAGDGEAGTLAERAINEKMEPKAIKQAIQVWRPDHFRV